MMSEITTTHPKIGDIPVGMKDITASGCLAVMFRASDGLVSDQLNAYAKTHTGHLLMWMQAVGDDLLVLYTSTLNEDERWVLDQRSEAIEKFVRERIEERAKNEAAEKEIQAKTKAEEKRLLELGRKCEQNHAKDFKPGKKK